MISAPRTYDDIPHLKNESARVSSMRLRRVMEDDSLLTGSQISARMILHKHGGLNIQLINRMQKHSRSFFSSQKNGLVQFQEGRSEEFIAKFHEGCGHYRDYECHPHELRFMWGGKMQRYLPDLIRVVSNPDGTETVEVIEIKRHANDRRDARYRVKLAGAKEVYRTIGWRFLIIDAADFFASPEKLPNVERIFGRRFMILSSDELAGATRVYDTPEPITWSRLSKAVAPGDRYQGDAVIEALLAKGWFTTDLNEYITPRSVLCPTRWSNTPSPIRL